MGKKRKQRLCRICQTRPVWIGGDVKNPGPVCKKCYHAHVWPERQRRRQKEQAADTPKSDGAVMPTSLGSNLRASRNKRWNAAMTRYHLTLQELAMAQTTSFEPRLMQEVATRRSLR